MTLKDFKGLINKNQLEILEIKNEADDYYSIKLKLNDKINWRPGEHGVFTLPEKKFKGKKWRAFSVASTMEEGYLLIGTRTGQNISSYKKQLTQMRPGEKVNVMGPFGWFTVKDVVSPIVLIAGGVGITPIRALLKQLEHDKSREIEVIYSSKEYHLFGEELKEIAKNNEKITFHIIKSKNETEKAVSDVSKRYKNFAYYYISGSFDIIKSTRKLLKKEGIKGKRLVHDPFFGY